MVIQHQNISQDENNIDEQHNAVAYDHLLIAENYSRTEENDPLEQDQDQSQDSLLMMTQQNAKAAEDDDQEQKQSEAAIERARKFSFRHQQRPIIPPLPLQQHRLEKEPNAKVRIRFMPAGEEAP